MYSEAFIFTHIFKDDASQKSVPSFEATFEKHIQQNMPLYSVAKAVRGGSAAVSSAHLRVATHAVGSQRPYLDVPITFTPPAVKPAFQNSLSEFDVTADPAGWYGDTTHPKDHDPQSFRYMVHAFHVTQKKLSDAFASNAQPYFSGHAVNKDNLSIQIKKTHGYSRLDAYYNPEKIGTLLSLSTSVINQDKRKTYGSAGLILQTTHSNIIAARGDDLYVNNASRESVMEVAKKGRLTAFDLLAETSSDSINEVLIGGNPMQLGPIRIMGMFYKVDKEGLPLDSQNADHFKALAEKYGLTVVAIPE